MPNMLYYIYNILPAAIYLQKKGFTIIMRFEYDCTFYLFMLCWFLSTIVYELRGPRLFSFFSPLNLHPADIHTHFATKYMSHEIFCEYQTTYSRLIVFLLGVSLASSGRAGSFLSIGLFEWTTDVVDATRNISGSEFPHTWRPRTKNSDGYGW